MQGRQIAAVDRQMDQLVVELYGLTDAEIALVEAATAPAARGASGEEIADDEGLTGYVFMCTIDGRKYRYVAGLLDFGRRAK